MLYNGDEELPDRKILRLSDAFAHPAEPDTFQWTAVMLNVNYGHNRKLLETCNTLNEYSIFVREYKGNLRNGMSLQEAVETAINYCIGQNILKSFLLKQKAGVIDMILTEYNEAGVKAVWQDESRTELLVELILEGSLTLEKGAAKLGISVKEMCELVEAHSA